MPCGQKQYWSAKTFVSETARWRRKAAPGNWQTATTLRSRSCRRVFVAACSCRARRPGILARRPFATPTLTRRPFSLKVRFAPAQERDENVVVPTLNLATSKKTCPKKMALRNCHRSRTENLLVVTNIGVRPTFNGQNLAIESHLFDFADN